MFFVMVRKIKKDDRFPTLGSIVKAEIFLLLQRRPSETDY